jgi:pyoverdine/dityrosine biosynthesis protein Dit1
MAAPKYDAVAHLNATVRNKPYKTTISNQIAAALTQSTSEHCFELLYSKAVDLRLTLHRQPSLGPEFGPETFVLTKHQSAKFFDSLHQVDAHLCRINARATGDKKRANPACVETQMPALNE